MSAWILVILLMVPSAVQAHSSLVKSEPADGERLEQSPLQVTAWFGEELDSQYSKIRVLDSRGKQVDYRDGGVDLNDLDHLSMIASLPSLSSGSYEVHWTAVSAEDGDQTDGLFEFHVGSKAVTEESSATSKSDSTILFFGGALIVLGLSVSVRLRRNRQSFSS